MTNDLDDHCVTIQGDADDSLSAGDNSKLDDNLRRRADYNLILRADDNPAAGNMNAYDHSNADDNFKADDNLKTDDNLKADDNIEADDELRLRAGDSLKAGDNLRLKPEENPRASDNFKADENVEADGNLRACTHMPAVSTAETETVAAASEQGEQQQTPSFGPTETRRQKPLQLPKLRNLQTTRSVQSFTTSMSSFMARSGRNKPIVSIKKPIDLRSVQQDTKLPQSGMRNALTSREKTAAAAVKRRKFQRGVAGGKRYSNNGFGGKSKRDSYPVKLQACQQPYLSDPTHAGVLPPDTSSLRWEYAMEDPVKETERLCEYKANRRKRYMAAAKMASGSSKMVERTASRAESVMASRTISMPCVGDGPGLLPRIPGVERIFPARMTNPKLLVGCS